jgi:hypothetical protein
MAHPHNKSQIHKVQAYLKRAEVEINKLGIVPRLPYRHPFDILGLAILSKVFALSKACLKLVALSFPDEAFGLSRSIVECATILRYLTAEPALQDKRSKDFAKFAMADKAFWAHYALEYSAGTDEEFEIRQYMEQEGIVADTKPARRHWSGEDGFVWKTSLLDHPLDGVKMQRHRKAEHAFSYYQTTQFVHCSTPAVDSYCPDEGIPFCISPSSGLRKTSNNSLFVVTVSVHSSIGYALFGMNLDCPTKLGALYQATLERLVHAPA